MGLRENKKRATRNRLVDAALYRFSEYGYDATTVEEIAADAQVSVPTFFRYFGSKDGVVFTDVASAAPGFCSALAARPAHESDLEAIRQVLHTFRVRDDTDYGIQRRLRQHRVVAATPVLRGRNHEVSTRWKHEVAVGLSQRRAADPEDRDIRLTAAIALAIVSFADDEWCAREGTADWLGILDEVFELHMALAASLAVSE